MMQLIRFAWQVSFALALGGAMEDFRAATHSVCSVLAQARLAMASTV
jgi:hypothetical protein